MGVASVLRELGLSLVDGAQADLWIIREAAGNVLLSTPP